MSTLEDLRNKGLIETVEPDRATATRWLDDAGRHLEAAKKIAELDPSGAYVLAYDAARKSVAAGLLMSGQRILSRPASHQALAQYARLAGWPGRRTCTQTVRSVAAQPKPIRVRITNLWHG